jgi:hypothetical protein
MLPQALGLRQRPQKNARMSRPTPPFRHKLPNTARIFAGYRKLIFSVPIPLTFPLWQALQ